MLLFVNLDTQLFQSSQGVSSRPNVSLKRGDTGRVRVIFLRDREPVLLAAGAHVALGIKEVGKYDADFLAFAPSFEEPVGGGFEYAALLGLNTDALKAALAVNETAADDVTSLQANLEVTWTEDGVNWLSTESLRIRIDNDVVRGDEASPFQEPNPAEWLSERAVRYDIDQLLTAAEQLRVRENLGLDGAFASSEDVAAVLALFQSDDTTLDELQEVVDYIKANRATLTSLGIGNISGLQQALDDYLADAVAAAALDATAKANQAEALAIATAAFDATAKADQAEANAIDASLSQVFISPQVAYVSATGNNATAILGNPLRPYATVAAALSTAAETIQIIGTVTVPQMTFTRRPRFFLSPNAHLIFAAAATFSAPDIGLEIKGFGDVSALLGQGLIQRFTGQNQNFEIDIRGDVIAGPNSEAFVYASTEAGGTISGSIRASRIVAQGTSQTQAAITSGAVAGPNLFIGGGTRLYSPDGRLLVLVGAAGLSNPPPIVFHEGCKMWTNGTAAMTDSSAAILECNGLYAQTGKTTGTVTLNDYRAVSWLREDMFLNK